MAWNPVIVFGMSRVCGPDSEGLFRILRKMPYRGICRFAQEEAVPSADPIELRFARR